MKRITTILTMLMLVCMGAWATTGTITVKGSSDTSFDDRGSFSIGTSWHTMWQSDATPCLTITCTKNSRYMSGSTIATSDYAMFLPLGYRITGYTISFKSNSKSGSSTITGYGPKKANKGSVTSSGSSDEQTLTVSGISTQSVEFKVATNHANVTSFTVTYETADDVMPFEQGSYYRMKIYSGWVTNYYLYAYRSESNTDRLKKGSAASAVLTNSNYIWKASSVSGSQVQFQNLLYGYYIAKLPTNAEQVNASITNSSDEAETFNVIERSAWGTGYVSLLPQSPITTAMTVSDNISHPFHFLDACSSTDSLMYGLNREHQGDVISVIRVKTVTFSSAVAVNGGVAVSTIYVATDGSDSFTLPANYKYTIAGVEMNGAQAATVIAAAGTSDISVTVSSPILVDNQKYRIQQAWSSARYYCYANTSDASNGNRLWKSQPTTTTLLTNANYIWQAKSSSTNWKLYNPAADGGNGRYIAKATNTSVDGSSVNALSASSADDAETFTLVSAESCDFPPSDYSSKCYVALKSNTQTNTYLNSYSSGSNAYYVGWHNAVHAGYYFSFIPVKTVSFIDDESAAFAVAVDGGSAVSTIYVATDGNDSFTLPSSYLYSINGADAVINTEAVEAIVAAGTADITVTVSDNPSRTVTYNLVWNGETIDSEEDVETYLSTSSSEYLPSSFARDFVEFSYDPETIGSETTEVNVTATWNGPFEISSSFASAEWYVIHMRQGGYNLKYTNADATYYPLEAAALLTESNLYKWAFIGDPFDGFQIVNEGAGSDNTLYAGASPANGDYPLMSSSNTTKWIVNGNPKNSEAGGFGLQPSGASVYLNDYSNGKKLRFWENNTSKDVGSTLTVQKFYPALVAVKISPYFDSIGQYFSLSSSAEDLIAKGNAWAEAKTSCSKSTYDDLLSYVTNTANIRYPATGYYRLRNYNYSTSYLGQESNVAQFENGGDKPCTIVKLTKDDDSNTYTIQLQGKYVQTPVKSTQVTTGNSEIWFTPSIGNPRIFSMNAGGNQYGCLHNDRYQKIVGWEAVSVSNNAPSYWYLEDANSLTVPMNSGGDGNTYATLYLPFGATIDGESDVNAYILGISGEYALATNIGQNIPANTGVMLKGTATSVNLAINDDATATTTGNVLTGTCVQATATNTSEYKDLVLGLGATSGTLGFYLAPSGTLAANKAYIHYKVPAGGEARVAGFPLLWDDELTGISGAKHLNDQSEMINDKQMFDLQGRRVENPQRGLYIVGGRKIVIK